MVNTKKLIDRMKTLGVTQALVAKKLNLARPTVSQKLNNVRPMFLDEAESLCKLLEIDMREFSIYFFANGVA